MAADDTLTIVDCTLRDGGYYNAWLFDRDMVRRYLSAACAAGVGVVEIGFRQPATKQFLGPFAFSSDRYLASLNVPTDVALAVMTDAKVLLAEGDVRATVDALYGRKSESRIDIVRLAAGASELPALGPAVAALKSKGYAVCVNLMQMGRAPACVVTELARTAAAFDGLDVLYLADTFGNMHPDGLRAAVDAVRTHWDGPLGIHTHDNMNLALANSLAGVDTGVTWLDATVLGMGRGAGNVALEYLLHALQGRGIVRCRPDALLDLIVQDFMPLRQQYGWGPNFLYYLAARHEIHPTYLQRLQEPGSVDTEALVNALDYLRAAASSAFSEETLGKAMRADSVDIPGSWSAAGWAEGRDVLLVANGSGAVAHRDAVEHFIATHRPRVIALNHVEAVHPDLIDAYAVCHPTRLTNDAPAYRTLAKPLIVPMDEFARRLLPAIDPHGIKNFGLTVRPGVLSACGTGCTIPSRKVAPYALAVSVAAGARRIFLAGFDGFDVSDWRQQEMNDLFALFRKSFPSIALIALTPTRYDVTQSSIYAY